MRANTRRGRVESVCATSELVREVLPQDMRVGRVGLESHNRRGWELLEDHESEETDVRAEIDDERLSRHSLANALRKVVDPTSKQLFEGPRIPGMPQEDITALECVAMDAGEPADAGDEVARRFVNEPRLAKTAPHGVIWMHTESIRCATQHAAKIMQARALYPEQRDTEADGRPIVD
jgi:hypothetical protein